MQKASIEEARAHLSALVDEAEHHHKRTLILRHGKPVAAIVPVDVAVPPMRHFSGAEIEALFAALGAVTPEASAVEDLELGPTMKLVLDASVAVAAARPSEPSHAAAWARVSRVLAGLDAMVVPVIFPIEVGASLARVGEPTAAVCSYVDALMSVASDVVTIGPLGARKIRDTAIAARLRAADAAYVWLAVREAVPLCTLDREMTQRGGRFCQVIPP